MPFTLGTQVQGALDDHNHEMATSESFKRQFATYAYETAQPVKSRTLTSPKKPKKKRTKNLNIGSIKKHTIQRSKNEPIIRDERFHNTLVGSKDWLDIKERLVNGINLKNTVLCDTEYSKEEKREQNIVRNSYTYPSDLSTEDFVALYDGFNCIKGGSDEIITLSQALFDSGANMEVKDDLEIDDKSEFIEIGDSCDEGYDEGFYEGDFEIPNSSGEEIDIITLSSDEEGEVEEANVSIDDDEVGNNSRLEIISKIIKLDNPDTTIPDSEASSGEDIEEFLTAKSKLDDVKEAEMVHVADVSHISIMDTTICDNAESSEIDISFSKVETKVIREEVHVADSIDESDINISYSKARIREVGAQQVENTTKVATVEDDSEIDILFSKAVTHTEETNKETAPADVDNIMEQLDTINNELIETVQEQSVEREEERIDKSSRRMEHFKDWNSTQLANQLTIWGIKRSTNSKARLLEMIEEISNQIAEAKWNWAIENTTLGEPLDFSKYPEDEPVLITNNIDEVISNKVTEILKDERFNYKVLIYKPINIHEIIKLLNKDSKVTNFKEVGSILDKLGVCWTELEG